MIAVPAALATLLQLRLQRSATLLELTQTVPELSRQEWRRVHTQGYSLSQLVAMAAAVGARATLHRLTAARLGADQSASAGVSRPALWPALQCADRYGG